MFRRNRMCVGEYLRFICVQGTGRNIPDPVFVGLVAFHCMSEFSENSITVI